MESSQMGRLVFLLLLICFADAATAASGKRRPGFLYIRNSRTRCTPQFWNRREAWPRMVPQTATVSKVFGSRALERYRSDMTLLESTAGEDNGNVFGRLMKEATAALLNSYARKGFPYSGWEVKTLLVQALVSEDAAARVAKRFAIANDACN